MKRQFLLLFLVIEFLMVLPGHGEGVTYYVKPSQSSQCPGQPCETFQYYLENVNTTLNKEKNIIMKFLIGKHIVKSSKYFTITTPIIRMTSIGEGEESDVKLLWKAGLLEFSNNTVVVFKYVRLIEWSINIVAANMMEFLMSSVVLFSCIIGTHTMPQTFGIENSVSKGGFWALSAIHLEGLLSLNNCTFHDMLPGFSIISFEGRITAQVRDCAFIKTPISITQGSIVLSGATVFRDTTYNPAILSYQGHIILSGTVLFVNNSALRGGAMALYSSTLNISANTVVTFSNNSATQLGGAIYIAPGVIPMMILDDIYPRCPYQLLNCSANSTYKFIFEGNSATNGGDNIYGVSLTDRSYNHCRDSISCNLTIHTASSSNSSISSDPLHVCLCNNNSEPQCKNNSYTSMNARVSPGETITLSLVVVGGDFGLTVGTVYTNIYQPNNSFSTTSLSPDYGQVVRTISTCTKVNYTLYSQTINSFVVMYITTIFQEHSSMVSYHTRCDEKDHNNCFLRTPVFINFTILPCPPGFILLDNPSRCDCYSIFTDTLNVTCHITKGIGYFSWTGDLWINIYGNEILYDKYCPHNYCKKNNTLINLKNLSSQCDFNRARRLCGQCKEGYSLAIGSSNCIHCQTNNNLSIIIFFAVAGLLLVFFIGILNITVTQGAINGLIFYANIIWAYNDIFFTQEGTKNAVMILLKAFIAWLNLDFGIETCFVKGLTAFWKTWLQYVFPFYIWIIAGSIIVATRCSTRLTNLLGNRAVPLLATLFLLSYMKLLRIAVSTLEFSILSRIDNNTSSSQLVVWSVDGNLGYFEFPHILLFLAGLVTLLFLWMPYTLLLFLMQWLRRLPQSGLLRWVMSFNPLYDAYFAPLKHKHHYWFGALLLARGILLVAFASSFAIPQDINLLILLLLGMFLVYYMMLNRPYKHTGILLLQSSYLMNLTILSGLFFFSYRQPNGPLLQSIAIGISTGFAFVQFFCTVVHAMIASWCCKGPTQTLYAYEADSEPNIHSDLVEQQNVRDRYSFNGYRDSIFNESEPLLPTY